MFQPTIAVPITPKLDGRVTPYDLEYALMRLASDRCGRPDDVGHDWYTDTAGNTTIIADSNYRVSTDPAVAALVDVAHVLLGHDLRRFRLTPEDLTRAARERAP